MKKTSVEVKKKQKQRPKQKVKKKDGSKNERWRKKLS